MLRKIDYSLYLVTDSELMTSATVEEAVELAILGGVTIVQLREKKAASREFFETAKRVREITARYNIPLIINDRADIADAVNADGVHVGQSDLPADAVRKIIGAEKIIGVSASSLEEAKAAQKLGADYLGIGAMYATNTKSNAQITSLAELSRIRSEIALPLIVIGGINEKTIPNLSNSGIDGIALVSAIIAQKDITASARAIKEVFSKVILK
jgi:thiamine-phosphate pyrophosphorylase